MKIYMKCKNYLWSELSLGLQWKGQYDSSVGSDRKNIYSPKPTHLILILHLYFYSHISSTNQSQIHIQMDRETIGLKLVIVGDGAVGKTSLLFSYAQNKFPRDYQPTVFDNKTTTLKIDQHIIHLGLWDTAGQEQYARLRPLAYNNADIFMVTFSVVDRDSYNNVVRKWYKEIGAVAANSVVLIVGNKIDLRNQAFNSADFVTKAEAEKFAKSHKCQYSECSALTRQGLVQTFEKAVRLALEMRNKDEKNMKAAEDSCPCQLI